MPETVLFEWSKRDKRHGHHKSDGSPVEYSDTGRGTCRSDTVLCSARVIQLWSKKKTPDGYTTKVLVAIIGYGQFNIRCLDAGAGNVALGVAVSCTGEVVFIRDIAGYDDLLLLWGRLYAISGPD